MTAVLKPWAAAVGIFLVGSVMTAVLQINAHQQLDSNGRLVRMAAATLLVYLLMALTAALLGPADRAGSAIAGLTVPAVTLVGGVVLAAVGAVSSSGALATTAAGLVGAGAGWLAVVWFRGRREPKSPY